MSETAENLVDQYGISRDDQDAFAFRSQQRAAAAMDSGHFDQETVPVVIPQRKGAAKEVRVDEHPRRDTTIDALSRLKPVVNSSGTVTAGNAAGINDGAAALLVASDTAVSEFGLQPLARIVGAATAGVPPRIMGIGPVPATHKVLQLTGLKLEQMDVVELNEAFAAQALAVLRQLNLPDDATHVNPNGGAIALGHPLGASGARLIMSALFQLQRTGGRYALCTMCIGVGQGIAVILERA
jgi:acetyl-CoA acetyltransferase family protein